MKLITKQCKAVLEALIHPVRVGQYSDGGRVFLAFGALSEAERRMRIERGFPHVSVSNQYLRETVGVRDPETVMVQLRRHGWDIKTTGHVEEPAERVHTVTRQLNSIWREGWRANNCVTPKDRRELKAWQDGQDAYREREASKREYRKAYPDWDNGDDSKEVYK